MTSLVTATLTFRVQKWQLQKPKIFKVCVNFIFISEQNMHARLTIPSLGKNNKLFAGYGLKHRYRTGFVWLCRINVSSIR